MEIEDQNDLLDVISFSPDDEQLWGFRQGFFDQYDLMNGTLVDSLAIPEYSGSAIALSPDRKTLVTGVYDSATENSMVHFYAFGNLEPYFSDPMAYMIMTFQFSPDNKMVAGTSAQIEGSVTKIWDSKTGLLMKDFYNYDNGPTFSYDSTLAAFVKGNQFSIYATDSWVLQNTFQINNPASTNIPIFFLGNNQILAIQKTARLSFIDVNSGEELLELPEQVIVVNYAPMMNIIISNFNEKNIKLWGILQ